MRIALLAACVWLSAPAVAAPQSAAPAPIFRFETGGFWLNLHHFLYVLGRAEAQLPDAGRRAVAGAPADAARGVAAMSDGERARWRAAVSAYATGVSQKDLVFDAPLPAIAGALARAREAASLSDAGVDPSVAATLQGVADLYRRVWWPAHRAANEAWVASMTPLLAAHGPAILAYVTRAYALPWPADGYPVQVSAWSNWAGAYSTDGPVLVLSSLDRELAGLLGLETLFHEAMHQWDGPIFDALLVHARAQGIRISGGVTHAMIFYTAGEAVRSIAPTHVPYAEAAGVWERGMARFKPALEEIWKPWLDGRGTRDQALAALAPRVAIPR